MSLDDRANSLLDVHHYHLYLSSDYFSRKMNIFCPHCHNRQIEKSRDRFDGFCFQLSKFVRNLFQFHFPVNIRFLTLNRLIVSYNCCNQTERIDQGYFQSIANRQSTDGFPLKDASHAEYHDYSLMAC